MDGGAHADAVIETLTAAARRFTALLVTCADPDKVAVGAWSVRDVAAHVAGFWPAYLPILRGEGSPLARLEDQASLNATTLATVDERDLTKLAARIDTLLDETLATARAIPYDTVLPWHGGLLLPFSTVLAALAGEPLVHGYDIARATGRRWKIPSGEARAISMGLLPVLPHYVEPAKAADFRARFEVRLRGAREARAVLSFEDGCLTVEQPNGVRADCYLSADPAAFLLVSYGRIKPWGPALTGKIMAWGRKPYLGFRLPGLLRNP